MIRDRRKRQPKTSTRKECDRNWDRIVADLRLDYVDDILLTSKESVRAFDESINRYVAACFALDKEADRSRLPQLYRLLKSQGEYENHICEAAAVPIARLDGLRALPRLLDAHRVGAKHGHDNDGLNTVITDLVWHKWRTASPILLKMLCSRSAERRADAAWLMDFAAQKSVPAPKQLLNALRDRNSEVRQMAAHSLGSFAPRRKVRDALLKALSDKDERVRAGAASALANYGKWPEVVEAIDHGLSDGHDEVRAMSAGALGDIGDKSVMPLLRKASRDSSVRVSDFAREAIKKLKQ